MPNYSFRNKETGEEFDLSLSMAERETYLAENPQIEQILTSINIADPSRLGLRKPDSGFRDILKNIKKRNRGSKINTW
jgi:hypothetical protein